MNVLSITLSHPLLSSDKAVKTFRSELFVSQFCADLDGLVAPSHFVLARDGRSAFAEQFFVVAALTLTKLGVRFGALKERY